MEDFLLYAYTLGVEQAYSNLEVVPGTGTPDKKKATDAIWKRVAGKTFADRLSADVESGSASGISALLTTEAHRVFNQAMVDAVKHVIKPDGTYNGNTLFKTWTTMLDEKVRDTHDYLEGVTVPFDAKFITSDGDTAEFPGDFEYPENNVNCRCSLLFTSGKTL